MKLSLFLFPALVIFFIMMGSGCSCEKGEELKNKQANFSIVVRPVVKMVLSETEGTWDWPGDLERFDSDGRLNIYRNSVGIDFVRIPAGKYRMGATAHDGSLAVENERPQHEVEISRSFLISRTEVSQEQWARVMLENPSHFQGNRLPVESVTWYQVQEFLHRLNQREKTENYRLPTEAEWEYAARSGGQFRYSFGNSEALLSEYAWFEKSSIGRTREVGLLRPNAWGIYDMSGNVWEWVSDIYDEHWYSHGEETIDPEGPEDFRKLDFKMIKRRMNSEDPPPVLRRVKRGGGWGGGALFCRLSVRLGVMEDVADDCLGFRIVREIP